MSTLAKPEKPEKPNKPISVEDAVAAAATMFEQEYPYMAAFTKERLSMWAESLQEFEPAVIIAACKACMDESKHPPARAEVIQACREFTQFGKLQERESKRLDVDDTDPFPESDATHPIAKALATNTTGTNSKLLRIQGALMSRAVADGKPEWKWKGTEAERVIRNRIAEFDGVPYNSIPALVDKILQEEIDPFADERA